MTTSLAGHTIGVLGLARSGLAAAKLGHPTHDPHGDPIPNAKLEWPKT